MDRRSILLEMRKSGQLKGVKPCFVMVKHKMNNQAYSGEYILSIKDQTIFFQKISKIFHLLHPSDDFSINVKDYVAYKFLHQVGKSSFTLFQKDGKTIKVDYMTGTREAFSTMDNMERIAKELKALGLQDMEEIEDGKE